MKSGKKKSLNSAHMNIETGNRKFQNWQNSIEIFMTDSMLLVLFVLFAYFLGESRFKLNSDHFNA